VQDSTVPKHVRLDPLPLPASRESKGRKLHSRQDLAGRPAQPRDAAGVEGEGAHAGMHSGKQRTRRKSSAPAAGEGRRASTGPVRGSWLDVLSRSNGAEGNAKEWSDAGGARHVHDSPPGAETTDTLQVDYSRTRSAHAADARQDGGIVADGPAGRRASGGGEQETRAQGAARGQDAAGGALRGHGEGGGGGGSEVRGAPRTPVSADQTKTRSSTKKKPRRVGLSHTPRASSGGLLLHHATVGESGHTRTRARPSKDESPSHASPNSSTGLADSSLSHEGSPSRSPPNPSHSNPATPSSTWSGDSSATPKSAQGGTFILRRSPKAAGVLASAQGRGGREGVSDVGGAGGRRDSVQAQGGAVTPGEGAAEGRRKLTFSPSSPAGKHGQSTGEKRAARVRPPRLSLPS